MRTSSWSWRRPFSILIVVLAALGIHCAGQSQQRSKTEPMSEAYDSEYMTCQNTVTTGADQCKCPLALSARRDKELNDQYKISMK